MRNVIVATLLALPALAVARDARPAKTESHAGKAHPRGAMPEAAKAEEAKDKAEEAEAHGKGRAEEGQEKGEHEGMAHGAAGAMPPGMMKASDQGQAHGRPAVEIARAIVAARGDMARARAEARRGEKERVMAHLRAHAGHEMPMAALREELRRHARRMARLARVRELADGAKDADTVARADKLIEREDGRHERWMSKMGMADAPAATPPATVPAPAQAPNQGGTP